MPRKGSGRNTIGRAEQDRNGRLVLRASDVCGICGHGGARTIDHVIPYSRWPRDAYTGKPLPGLHAVSNLQPAHGTIGNTGFVNRCRECKALRINGNGVCNQSKSGRITVHNARSRDW